MALDTFINLALEGVKLRDRRETNIRDEEFRRDQLDLRRRTIDRSQNQDDVIQRFRESESIVKQGQFNRNQTLLSRNISVQEGHLNESRRKTNRAFSREDDVQRGKDVQAFAINPDGTIKDIEEILENPLAIPWLNGHQDIAKFSKTLSSLGITPTEDGGFLMEGDNPNGDVKPITRDRSTNPDDPAVVLSREEMQGVFEALVTNDILRGGGRSPAAQQAFSSSLPQVPVDFTTEEGLSQLAPEVADVFRQLAGPEANSSADPGLASPRPQSTGLTSEELAVEAPGQLSDDEVINLQKRIKDGLKPGGTPDVEALRKLQSDPRIDSLPRVLETAHQTAEGRPQASSAELSESVGNLKLLEDGPDAPLDRHTAGLLFDRAKAALGADSGRNKAETKKLRSALTDARFERKRSFERNILETDIKKLESEGKDATQKRERLFSITGRKADAPGGLLEKQNKVAKLSDFKSPEKLNNIIKDVVVSPEQAEQDLQALAKKTAANFKKTAANFKERRGIATRLFAEGIIQSPQDAEAYVRTGNWKEGTIVNVAGSAFYNDGAGNFTQIIDPANTKAAELKSQKERMQLIKTTQGVITTIADNVLGAGGTEFSKTASNLLVQQFNATPMSEVLLTETADPASALAALFKTQSVINRSNDKHNSAWNSFFTEDRTSLSMTSALQIHKLGLDPSSPDELENQIISPIRQVFGTDVRDAVQTIIVSAAKKNGKIGNTWEEAIRLAAQQFKNDNPGIK